MFTKLVFILVIFVVKGTQHTESCLAHQILTDIQPDHPARIVGLHQLQVLQDPFPVGGVAGAPEREGDNLLSGTSVLTSNTALVAGGITSLLDPEI